MTMRETLLAYRDGVSDLIAQLDLPPIEALVDALLEARQRGRTVFVMGNGGSAAVASHLACDLNKSLNNSRSIPFRALCLNESTPTLTAYANDVDYGDAMAEQLRNFVGEADLVIAFSGSGDSESVIRAVALANVAGATTFGVCGLSGGRLRTAAQHVIHVPTRDLRQAEDAFVVIAHLTCSAIDCS